MPFDFSEEEELFRREIKEFVKREIMPVAREIGKGKRIPGELWKKICDLRIPAINVPEKYGGLAGSWVMVGIACEELARGDLSLSVTLIPNRGFCMLLLAALPNVQSEWIPPIIEGEKLSCLAVTEPDCGTDAAALRTVARLDGGYYILSGEKTSVSWGMYADVAAVFAKTAPHAGAKGISCFVVPLDLSGVNRSGLPDMGIRPVTRASLILDDVRIPKDYLVGKEGEGFRMIMEQFDLLRVMVCLSSIGAAAQSLDEAITYAKQRTAFGKAIAKFEGISFKIAEDATMLEAGRWLCYRTLWLKDRGAAHTKEAAMCKSWVPNIAVKIIHDALLIHGHVGYSAEYLLEQRLRDAIGNELADGSIEAMKLTITRELLGKEFLPYR